MIAIPNRVVVGDVAEPLLVFENNNIVEVLEETGTSPIGDELFIDQFMPSVNYGLFIRYRIIPKDVDVYQGIVSADGKIVGSMWNYDIRNIPYGTPVRFYSNGKIAGLFYCDNVERKGKNLFKINCVSAIGMMSRQRHIGGIYNAKRFDDLVDEIIEGEYEYQIAEDVAQLQVFGWLPYSTKRRNLHQLLVAYGVTITKSDTGAMLFVFVNATDSFDIPNNRVFAGGSVTYGEPASRVEILEHSFHALSTVEYEQIFDTDGNEVEGTLVVFDKPIVPETIVAGVEDTLEVLERGVNYAFVRGNGKLYGQPYVHNTKLLIKENEDALTEKVVTVEEATLITVANSTNALERISNYYFNAITVQEDIVVADERTGRRYDVRNAFYEKETGFLAKMLTQVSSFRRAQCEFISGYIPIAGGTSFIYRDLLHPTDDTQIWNVPDIVFEKDVSSVRVVLIGRGEDGHDGENGEDGHQTFYDEGGRGGIGGRGGAGGHGGRILDFNVDCQNLAFLRYGRDENGEVWLRAGDDYYTSADGLFRKNGFTDIMDGTVYALGGDDGVYGANGGKGGSAFPFGKEPNPAENGENLTYEGTTFRGGRASKAIDIDGKDLGIGMIVIGDANAKEVVKFGGAGGGGAAVGSNGQDGVSGYDLKERHWNKAGDGGKGADAVITNTAFGCGGNGGHGGGGGGGCELVLHYVTVYNHINGYYSRYEGRGRGGAGGKGSRGMDGCIIIYY